MLEMHDEGDKRDEPGRSGAFGPFESLRGDMEMGRYSHTNWTAVGVIVAIMIALVACLVLMLAQ